MIVTDLPSSPFEHEPVRLNLALIRATVAISLVGTPEALGRVGLDPA